MSFRKNAWKMPLHSLFLPLKMLRKMPKLSAEIRMHTDILIRSGTQGYQDYAGPTFVGIAYQVNTSQSEYENPSERHLICTYRNNTGKSVIWTYVGIL